MRSAQEDSFIFQPKRYYIKRQTFKHEQSLINGSIFNMTPNAQSNHEQNDKPYQTITTTRDMNTINSNNILTINSGIGSNRQQNIIQLPAIKINPQSITQKIQNMKTITSDTTNMNYIIGKVKPLSHHVSDPFYLALQKTATKRMTTKFKEFKRQWVKTCIARKETSLIQRSLEKSIQSIDEIHKNARRRRNTTNLQQLLRNNILQKKFIMPANFKPEIQGLKGKGGKLMPLSNKYAFRADEVFKLEKSQRISS